MAALLFISDANEFSTIGKFRFIRFKSCFYQNVQRGLELVLMSFLKVNLFMQIVRRLLFKKFTLVVARALHDILAYAIGYFAQINKIIGDVDQLRRGIGTKARDLYAASFVSDSIDRIDKVFVT